MKDFFKTGLAVTVCTIGWFAGVWVWNNVLEEKADEILSKVRGEDSKDELE